MSIYVYYTYNIYIGGDGDDLIRKALLLWCTPSKSSDSFTDIIENLTNALDIIMMKSKQPPSTANISVVTKYINVCDLMQKTTDNEYPEFQSKISNLLATFVLMCILDDEGEEVGGEPLNYLSSTGNASTIKKVLTESCSCVSALTKCLKTTEKLEKNKENYETKNIINLLKKCISKHSMNAELNLELGYSLLQQYRNINEGKHMNDFEILKDACMYAQKAVLAAEETLTLSIKENEGIGRDTDNPSIGVLSDAPELYQRSTALLHDIECIIFTKENTINNHEIDEFCGNNLDKDLEPSGPPVTKALYSNATMRNSNKQYQRGLHLYPTLANHELMIKNLVKVIL
jgi:hypothetical protein